MNNVHYFFPFQSLKPPQNQQMTLISPQCVSDAVLVFHSHRIFSLAGSYRNSALLGPDDLNHCYQSPCVCASLSVQVNLLLRSEALNNWPVSTPCVFAFFGPCVENFTFHRSQLRRHAAPAGIRATRQVRGTMRSQTWPECCLGVTGTKTTSQLLGDAERSSQRDLELPLPPSYVTHVFLFSWRRNVCEQAAIHLLPPPSSTFSDGVRLDDTAGAVGCTDGRVGGAGTNRGREEVFQLLDKQQRENNDRLNNNTSSTSHFFLLDSFAGFLGQGISRNVKVKVSLKIKLGSI